MFSELRGRRKNTEFHPNLHNGHIAGEMPIT